MTNEIVWLTADEDEYNVIQANSKLNEKVALLSRSLWDVTVVITKVPIWSSRLRGPLKTVVAVATACIPFLENDDSNRALMGANMQRQAAIDWSKPALGTGMEYQAALDSGAAVIAQHDGKVTYADADQGKFVGKMELLMFTISKNSRRSNSGTAYNQHALVKLAMLLKRRLADGPSMGRGNGP